MITKKDTIVKIRSNNLDGKGVLNICSQSPINTVELFISAPDGKEFAFVYPASGNCFVGTFALENASLWSVNEPNLYKYCVEINGGEESVFGSFGFRELSTNGKDICLNGTPLFVRGYIRGTTAHDHQNNAKLPLDEFYRKNISAAKKFGFNLVRFHSVVPDEAFLRAADELGLLVHIELRPPHDLYNNLEEMVTSGSDIVPIDFLKDVINRLYEHPSLAVYCIGNEIKNLTRGGEEVAKIKHLVDTLDGTRLFLDTCAWGENNRPNIDIDVQHMSYYFPFGKNEKMYEDTDNLLVVSTASNKPLKTESDGVTLTRTLSFRVPLIAHEVCHYTALRDFKGLKEKFLLSGSSLPWWVDEELKMIEAKGYTERYEEMYKASKNFQKECWKTAYEAMRTSWLLGGFHFLQFADTDVYENSNGVVDCFDDENYIRSEEFLRFNGDRVLVAKLGPRLYFEEDEIVVPVQFSNFGEDAQAFADFSFALLKKDGTELVRAEMKNIDVSRKGLYEICKLKVRMPKVDRSEELIFQIRLAANGEIYAQNEWGIWVYEKTPALSYREFLSFEKDGVTVTDNIEKAFNRLSKGEKVCLIYRSDWTRHVADKAQQPPMYAFKATWNRFKPVIWDRGTNYGGLCECEILGKYGFAGGKYYGFNYSALSEDCDKIILDDFPIQPKVLISGIDKSCRDRFDAYKGSFNLPDLMYDRTLRNFGYLFEMKVGEGSLLVCGLNLTRLDENEPSTVGMANTLLRYLQSADFAPIQEVALDTLKAYLQESALQPVKERMMTQFWELDDAPVESKRFWIESREYLLND